MRLIGNSLLTLAIIMLFNAADAHADEATRRKKVATARRHFQHLTQNNFDKFHDGCDRRMQDALSPKKLAEIWNGVLESQGAFKSEAKSDCVMRQGYAIVTLTCVFERAKADVTISIDREDRVSGLFFKPIESTTAYKPPTYVSPNRYQERPITVTADRSFPLPGTLTIPNGKGPFPGVVLVHGSGPNDRDESIGPNKPFKDIALGLASRGIAVLRYDKRTHQHGARIDPTTITIDTEVVDDAVAAAQAMRAQHEVNNKSVFVLGHSLGATAAPRIASKDQNLAGAIMLAAAARPLHDLVEDQLLYLAEIDGVMSGAEIEQIAQARNVIQRLRDKTWLGDDTLLGTPAAYWAGLKILAPVETAKQIMCPLLILHGGRDYQVTEKDFIIWQQTLAHKTNVTLTHFAAMDHLFRRGTEASTPQEYQQLGYVDVAVIDKVANWILTQSVAGDARD